MLEGLVAWVLNNYLGKYVENLNTDQLSIALLQGEVELENLPLKKNALRYLGLPIEVRSGLIGKVKLQIPVRQIRSAPWVIIIEQLHLVAGPVNLDLWEESVEEAAELEHKLGLLDAIEARWRAETEAGSEPGYYASSYSSWLSYGTSLVTNIVENLQLRIKDVHLRYEDDMTVEGRCFAAGITVAALSAQSCDDRWNPGMQATPASAGVSYKLLEMSSLGIYWDTCGVEEFLSSLPHLQLTLALSSAWTQSHQWILNPTSAQAQVKRNRSEDPLRSKTTPRLVCDLQLEDVILSITDIQYEEMFDCFRGLNDLDRRRTWRRHRPCTLKDFLNNIKKLETDEGPKISEEDQSSQSKEIILDWWRYAIRCHLPNARFACGDPRWNWETGLRYAKENVLYVESCQRLLTHPTSPLTAESKMLKEQVELNRPYEQLRALREAAMRRARPARRVSIPSVSPRSPTTNPDSRDNVAGGRSLLVRWFPQWWGWYESPQSQPTASPDTEAEILEALAADADSIENDHTVLRRDTVFGQFHFKLKRGSIRLAAASPIVNSSVQTKLELAFEHLLLGFESRPRSSSHRLRLKLGSVTLNDRITPDTLFPVLITPPGLSQKPSSQLYSIRRLITKLPSPEQPLFELVYESGPDKKLHVCSQALEVVYNPEATKWLLEFVSRPHRTAARRRLEQIRQRTKDEFFRNWDQVLKGNNVNLTGTNRTWHIELDVSAPHIVLVENLTDRNSAITVVDFGKLHFSNRPPSPPPQPPQINIQSTSPTSPINNLGTESDPEDDDDLFATPCSTPPGSEVSSSEEVEGEALTQPSPLQTNQRLTSQPISDVPKNLTDRTLHDRLYERYNIELSEIQVLVGRVRDNWQYAHLKGTSALHLLDRVNISIQAERRLVYTHDPRYPAVTINARVPRLVVHLNENKVDALRILARQLAATSPSSPFRQPECQTPTNTQTDFIKAKSTSTSSTGETFNSIPGSEDVSQASEAATAALGCVAQFTVETLALEIQSRGRAVAELQVSGVRAGFQQRPLCQQISLSVHSLLLVDALQAFGPDFELLIASHKHVGMDSLSGSIRGSEPTSPISPTSPRSPASPEPPIQTPGTNTSSLHHLAQVLASLKRPTLTPTTNKQSTSLPLAASALSPVPGASSDAEALITVEITLLQADPKAENSGESIRIAAVQFNNLDVTANQETIVELLGFARRIFPETVSKHSTARSSEKQTLLDNPEIFSTVSERTELTFDFHRLSVLLLRGVVRDHTVIGKKIATATMAEAKFHASFESNGVVQVKGSLGGLQVVDLTPEGSHHQRIISVGKDPLDIMTCLHSGLYGASYDISLGGFDVSDALTIQVDRTSDELIVILRVASVWYTHSRHLLRELHSCAAEFESYLREIARSLSARAAEMALGLSTPRRHRRKSSSASSNSYSGFLARSNERLDSPDEEPISSLGVTETTAIPGPDINIKLEVELDSPVLVFPRHATSNEVLVAHLGTIHVGNRRIDTSRASGDDIFWDQNQQRQHSYYLEVRDMNVYSLDITERITNTEGPLPRAERIYACRDHGRPILHDTMVSIQVEHFESISTNNEASILLEDFLASETPRGESFNVTGGVVTPLRLALSRAQYEQVLDTLKAVLNPEPISQPSNDTGPATMHAVVRALSDIAEETPGVATLRMDPAVRARLHSTSQHQASATPVPPPPPPAITALFTIPELTLELRTDVDQKALVELCLQDFAARWERPLGGSERHLQVSLRSICFEDLLQPADSPHRRIVQSSGQGGSNPWMPSLALSRSCPDMLGHVPVQSVHGSLPDHLEAGTIFGAGWGARGRRGGRPSQGGLTAGGAPATPPPSPRPSPDTSLHARADNLVHVDAVLNDTHREIAVRFNALDVIFNIESWVVVLDFFGLGGGTNEDTVDGNFSEDDTNKSSLSSGSNKIDQSITNSTLTTTMDIEVRAFSVQLNHPASTEIARLTASHFSACLSTIGSLTTRLHARLGRLIMQDLTKHGTIYRDRFMTAVGARETLSFNWESTSVEASLTLSMASVVYVHTQRFLTQVLGFFRHFSQLQEKLRVLRRPPSENSKTIAPKKVRLSLNAGSPLILIPLSSQSSEMLVADLGELTASNHFEQIHSKNDLVPSPWIETTDVQLVRMDIYASRREFRNDDQILSPGLISFKMPSYVVVKRGPSLLKDKCELNLEVQRNIEAVRIPGIADMCVRGRLSTLKFDLDLGQYRLLRGLLAKNIGENLDDIVITVYVPPPPSPISHNNNPPTKWTTNSLQLELRNISILIRDSHESNDPPIARVDLIRSKLLVETFSDRTQDVDLLSQEILLSDTRFLDAAMNKRGNIFSSILKPARTSSSDHVQVEIHHRRRHDFSKFTVMLNNMRLIAVVDWWQAMNEFVLGSDSTSDLFQTFESSAPSPTLLQTQHLVRPSPLAASAVGIVTKCAPVVAASADGEAPWEFKLNVTDCELVLVEDTSRPDSVAIILKSTTVLSWRPRLLDRPLSCNLNRCEIVSCVLGHEEETALSVVDPVTVNIDIARRKPSPGSAAGDAAAHRGLLDAVAAPPGPLILEVQLHQLAVRLSYQDMRVFVRMLESLPKQTRSSSSRLNQPNQESSQPANVRCLVDKLRALGFSTDDCVKAIRVCHGHLDEAALWLTHNAETISDESELLPIPATSSTTKSHQGTSLGVIDALELKAHCISICIIDDCLDCDVPLIEVSLAQLALHQDLLENEDHSLGIMASESGNGWIKGVFSAEYYNRSLSGWEPWIEPWRGELSWLRTPTVQTTAASPSRFVFNLTSDETLDMTITSTFVELISLVKDTWTADVQATPRRRQPFIPYALQNSSGSALFFGTCTSDINDTTVPDASSVTWMSVSPGETKPFTFDNARRRIQHRRGASHGPRAVAHQLTVQVDGWRPITPVTIDQVGIYFRDASADPTASVNNNSKYRGILSSARIVLEVTLEGTSRKLITIRSSLQITNQLLTPMEIRLENPSLSDASLMIIEAGSTRPVPLAYATSTGRAWTRPATPKGRSPYAWCSKPFDWSSPGTRNRPGQAVCELRDCFANDHVYRVCIVMCRENFPPDKTTVEPGNLGCLWSHPCHTITLLAPITLNNLLPFEIYYSVAGRSGRLAPNHPLPLHHIDPEAGAELSVQLENYPTCGTISIPPTGTTSSSSGSGGGLTATLIRVRLSDSKQRRLHLAARIKPFRGGPALQISLSAPFWLINKTALPLVFRQEGVSVDGAGQFDEHEVARMVAPLLFSFSDPEASPTVSARVGTGLHPDLIPQWSHPFTLQPGGVQVRRLRVAQRENRPDIVYLMAVEARPGRGKHRPTTIVTLSPRYQLRNRSSLEVQFAQQCLATTVTDPGAQKTHLKASPGCNLPFHWPRLDKDQLLCVRLPHVPGCLWSGGFRIDIPSAFHLSIRDATGRMNMLRCEVTSNGPTLCATLSDADGMPPPLRIDNFSEVPIKFFQTCVTSDHLATTVRAHCSIPFAWDEPIQAPFVTLVAPGGVSCSYDTTKHHEAPQGLTYENFIYIALTGTFKPPQAAETSATTSPTPAGEIGPWDMMSSQQLVLSATGGSGSRVTLACKQPGARDQLWRLTPEGHLQHEGSSPPSLYPTSSDKILVLDIIGPAPQPTQHVALSLRRPDPRRKTTQTWQFTPDGRLCCAHHNMCVQAMDGFLGLRPGSEAVLGPQRESATGEGPPLEQAVSKQKLRPGSGFLSVSITTDGPTTVVYVVDSKASSSGRSGRKRRRLESIAWSSQSPIGPPRTDIDLTATLPRFGLSLVQRSPAEELLYITFNNVNLHYETTNSRTRLQVDVRDLQVDNQLWDAQSPVVLFTNTGRLNTNSSGNQEDASALMVDIEKTTMVNVDADMFRHFVVRTKNLVLNIEERLLLKLFLFAGYDRKDTGGEGGAELDGEITSAQAVMAPQPQRYYLERIQIVPSQVRLSVITSNKQLPPVLASIKRRLGLTLIRFEDACIEVEPFVRTRAFEPRDELIQAALKHYKAELKWQAAFILGSVDFLGNPIGFVNDVSEGVSGLIYEGSVGALVKNVTHGISNSAAKVTESLSDGLGRVTMDERHEESRRKILRNSGTTGTMVLGGGGGVLATRGPTTSGEHLIAGLKGLGLGLLGGVTSVFKQSYEGAANEGLQGFVAGFGKGLVGTVTKPVVGVLDLASETASAVRESSRSSNRTPPERIRPPRVAASPGGLLPPYSRKDAQGQQFLHSFTDREKFSCYEILRSGQDDLRILVSSENVRVFSCIATVSVIIQVALADIFHCIAISVPGENQESLHYIELTMVGEGGTVKRPRVRCDMESTAQTVTARINHARRGLEQRRQTVLPLADPLDESLP